MIRSIVRVVEFVQGFEGNILRHEAYLYVFDAVPMAAVMVCFNIWYPSAWSTQARKQAILASESSESNVELATVEQESSK